MTAAREYIRQHGRPDDTVIDEIARRVVQITKQSRIILFGSVGTQDAFVESHTQTRTQVLMKALMSSVLDRVLSQ